jgi:hypothetical protein
MDRGAANATRSCTVLPGEGYEIRWSDRSDSVNCVPNCELQQARANNDLKAPCRLDWALPQPPAPDNAA